MRAALAVVVLVFLAAALPGMARGTDAPGALLPLGWTVSGPRVLALPAGTPGSPDGAGAVQPAVFRAANGTYLMCYTGSGGFGLVILGAFSRDGITWTKLAGSITLANGAASPFVMPVAGGYRMWFESVEGGVGPLGYTDRIYGATSNDGLNWTITGVVLDVGTGAAWDAGTVADPWVVQGPDGLYRMYYTMYAANGSIAIGVATSSDLVTFTKWSGNPVLLPGPAGSWDDAAVANPAVVSGSSWTLFYGGRTASGPNFIGLATSSDGYHWTRHPAPFLSADLPGTWDSFDVGGPAYLAGSVSRLYFDGRNSTGPSAIGFVNLTGSSSNSGPGGSVLGLPLADFIFLIAFVGIGVAVLVVAVVALRNETRRRAR